MTAPEAGVRIRPAVADDHAAIAGIQATSFPDRWSLDTVRRLAGIGGAVVLLAERGSDAAALGYLIGQVVGDEAEVPSVAVAARSEEHTSAIQSLMRISYAGVRLKKNMTTHRPITTQTT